MSSSHERMERDGGLSIEDKAAITDQKRVWEVRKYCQTRASLARHGHESSRTSEDGASLNNEQEGTDAALTALLRGVLTQLDADIAMISLLDAHTQFFLSGATQDDRNDGWVAAGSAQWYGCDQVNHHGGLCERTIAMSHRPGAPAFYEVLDMATTERTQNLPFINGTVACFRRYVGMPIRSPDGLNIGTVFTMSKTPATCGINETQRQYLYETTKNVMAQLVQATQALEGKRAERYNEALSRLLNGRTYDRVGQHEESNSAPEKRLHTSDVYRDAAKLLYEYFEFSGLIFQEIALAPEHSRNTSTSQTETLIASELGPGMAAIVSLESSAIHNLLDAFPSGGVLRIDDTGQRPVFAGAAYYDNRAFSESTNASLVQSFPGARQIMFTPLWDVVHNRATALCVGWVGSDSRVLRPETDLMSMSSFCMATMSLVLRMESQMLEQVKADFLGSISHETRSPLHGILGNLELALMTDCSSDLRRMLLDAKSGATQLLETLDKVLIYSRVQGQSKAASNGRPLHLVTDGFTPNRGDNEQHKSIVRIGSKSSQEDATSGVTNLIDLCEEIVEGVARQARFSERTVTPSAERKRSINDQYGFQDERSPARSGGWDGLVMFDSRSSENCQVRGDTPFRAILANLLGNAIKFTRSTYCVRSSLRLDADRCYLDVTDCGRGLSNAFIKHNLFVPFSQQQPLDSGVGLGLSLVKRNLDTLEGHMQLETDEALGSMAKVSIPLPRLIGDVEQKREDDSFDRGGTSVVPPMPRCEESELPLLKACIYAPCSGEDERGKRSIRLLHESLSHTLEAWFQPKMALWHEGQDECLPHLVFIAYPDLESFRMSSGEAFTTVKKVVVCADVDDESEYDGKKISAASRVADAIITGSILPSKLWKAVILFFPHIDPSQAGRHEHKDIHIANETQSDQKELDASHSVCSQPGTPLDGVHVAHNDKSGIASSPDRTVRPTESGRQDSEDNAAESKSSQAQNDVGVVSEQSTNAEQKPEKVIHGPSEEKAGLMARPRLLLVDDNNVNLKILAMFVKKCGFDADSFAQASGGQQAIDLYEEAASGENGPEAGFDIIFMDLSMPEVNGFDATSAIRRMEKSRGGKRSHIAALTGLVSDKDRHAANAAGTDEYITKPAGLKNVKDVIDKWKSKHPG